MPSTKVQIITPKYTSVKRISERAASCKCKHKTQNPRVGEWRELRRGPENKGSDKTLEMSLRDRRSLRKKAETPLKNNHTGRRR